MRNCSGCGAPTESTRCNYCGHVDSLQPASSASGVPDCGPCPRCTGSVTLTRSFVAGHPIDTCADCGGTWMGAEALRTIIEHHQSVAATGDKGRGAAQGSPESQVRYVRCPACREFMARKNYERVSGVIVDVCPDHGVWLDAGELEALGKFAVTGGRALTEKADKAKEDLDADVLRERRSGGPLSGDREAGLFGGIDLFD